MRKRLSIAFLAVIAATIFLLNSINKQRAAYNPVPEDASEIEQEEKGIEQSQSNQRREEEIKSKIKTINAFSREFTNMATSNARFYGKVVDQNDEPVEAVKVEFYLSKQKTSPTDLINNLRTGTSEVERELVIQYTDKQGLFSIENVNISNLRLHKITKDGYITDNGNGVSFNFSRLSYSEIHKPDPRNPAIFRVWEKGETESLVKGGGLLRVRDGSSPKIFTLDIISNKIYEGMSDKGHVVVELYNQGAGYDEETRKFARERYDWYIKATIENGGFLETNDTLAFGAPEFGYKETIEFGMRADDPNWSPSNFRKRYYLKTSRGNYGTSLLKIGVNKSSLIRIHFDDTIINPNGFTNLEYDKKKDVTKQTPSSTL